MLGTSQPRGRSAWWLLAATLALVALVTAGLLVGSDTIGLSTAVQALTAFDGSREHLVIRDIRLPRTLLGLAVGAALAVAGAVMQGLTRNPLASPSVFGVSAGASFAVVLGMYTGAVTSQLGQAGLAMAGAATAAVTVYLIGAGRTGSASSTPLRTALGGAVLTTALSAWTYTVMSVSRRTADEARFWLTGSLVGRPLDTLYSVLPILVLGLVLAFATTRSLNNLALGEENAVALGTSLTRTRVLAGLAVTALAGGSVAAAGPIAFVGLAVPHLVRLAVGVDHRRLLLGCLLVGPTLLITADLVGRVVARPGEIDAGIVTALLGAPVLIALARKAKVGRA